MSTLITACPGPGLFRAHLADDLDDDLDRGIFGQLGQEWTRLGALPSMAHTLGRWGRAEPVLAGPTSLGELVDRIDTSHSVEEDQLLLALLRLAQAGQQLAGRVLLQAMLPKISRMVRRMRPTSNDDRRIEDRRHIAVATFWEVLHTYPAGRRQTKIAANLALDTLHQLTSGHRKPPGDIPLSPDVCADRLAARAYEDPRTSGGGLSSDADLLEVIIWGLDVRAICAEEASLLVRVYLPDPRDGHRGADVAHELGLSHTVLRKRCSRARRRLVAAVRADIDGDPIAQLAATA